MTITLNGTTGITTPDVTSSGSLNIDASAPDNSLVVDASGNVGVGVTPSAWASDRKAMQVNLASLSGGNANNFAVLGNNIYNDGAGAGNKYIITAAASSYVQNTSGQHIWYSAPSGTAGNDISFTQAMTLDNSGNLLVGKTADSSTINGIKVTGGTGGVHGHIFVGNTSTSGGNACIYANRISADGNLIEFRQANTVEGIISVSGTTVTYGGGHLARFTQLPNANKDESLLKGTVLSNLDEMIVYVNKETGETVSNEQLNKTKVSDIEGDQNVAGVFVSWQYDEAHDVQEFFVAMTGDMIIRIAQGTTVQRGDLLMSAGDGTAKPQGDDIVRSKTIAKVTSTNVTCTYADGSFCVPCVLMAC